MYDRTNPETCLHQIIQQVFTESRNFATVCISCDATIDPAFTNERKGRYEYDIDANVWVYYEDTVNLVKETPVTKEVIDIPVTYTTTVDGTNIWGWRKLALEANAAACTAMAECDDLKAELQKYKEYYGIIPTPEEGS